MIKRATINILRASGDILYIGKRGNNEVREKNRESD